MRFKLRQMEVFRAIMLTGSMTGAARMLLVSQPSVSRLMRYTEQSLGLQLFHRQRGKLVPTAEAQLLFREVERLYQNARQVDDFASDLRDKPQGVLSIATSPSLALHFVPPAVRAFQHAHPDIRIQFRTTLLADMARELLSRQVSLAISVMPLNDPGILVEPLGVGRMVCIAPSGHAIEQREAVELRELAEHPMVLYDRTIPFGGLIAAAFERAGIRPRIAVEISRAELAFALVRTGIGPAVVDEFSVASSTIAGIVVRPLAEHIPVTLSLMQSRYERADTQTRGFIKGIKKHAVSLGLGI